MWFFVLLFLQKTPCTKQQQLANRSNVLGSVAVANSNSGHAVNWACNWFFFIELKISETPTHPAQTCVERNHNEAVPHLLTTLFAMPRGMTRFLITILLLSLGTLIPWYTQHTWCDTFRLALIERGKSCSILAPWRGLAAACVEYRTAPSSTVDEGNWLD